MFELHSISKTMNMNLQNLLHIWELFGPWKFKIKISAIEVRLIMNQTLDKKISHFKIRFLNPIWLFVIYNVSFWNFFVEWFTKVTWWLIMFLKGVWLFVSNDIASSSLMASFSSILPNIYFIIEQILSVIPLLVLELLNE